MRAYDESAHSSRRFPSPGGAITPLWGRRLWYTSHMRDSSQQDAAPGDVDARRLGPTGACGLTHNASGAEPELTDVGGPNVTSLLPEELLQPGELIVLMIKPSPWCILLESLRSLVAIGVLATAASCLMRYDLLDANRQDVTLAAAGLVVARLFWQFLDWLSRVYVLTDRRVVRVKGVVRVEVFEASLKQVQNTRCYFSLRERLFGLGTIGFATAGTATYEAYWAMVGRPLDVHHTVVRTIERYR